MLQDMAPNYWHFLRQQMLDEFRPKMLEVRFVFARCISSIIFHAIPTSWAKGTWWFSIFWRVNWICGSAWRRTCQQPVSETTTHLKLTRTTIWIQFEAISSNTFIRNLSLCISLKVRSRGREQDNHPDGTTNVYVTRPCEAELISISHPDHTDRTIVCVRLTMTTIYKYMAHAG